MFNLVIFGAPGSGKGTQSEKLIAHYGLTHISTGEVLRAEIAAGTELGKVADSYISKGQLIPDDLMVDILAAEVDRLRPNAQGFIFDGFPRTIPQVGPSHPLEVFHSTTSPLREYYQKEGKYHAIEGSGHVDEIFSKISGAIDKHPAAPKK